MNMVDNLSFLNRPHKCIICNRSIDPEKLKAAIFNAYRGNPFFNLKNQHLYGFELVIIEDFGNDVSVLDSPDCCIKWLESKSEHGT